MKSTLKLASIGSNALGDDRIIVNIEEFSSYGKLGDELVEMLALKNGFYAFESSLHVFPATHFIREMTLSRWNSHGLWKYEYREIVDAKLFFAEDAFGNQFCVFQNRIYSFDAETGETELIADSIEDWAKKIFAEYPLLTGHPLLRDWQRENGLLPVGHRLMPKIPFVLGGEYAISNLYSLNAVSSMKSRGNLAVQIRDLPDGTPIQFKIVE